MIKNLYNAVTTLESLKACNSLEERLRVLPHIDRICFSSIEEGLFVQENINWLAQPITHSEFVAESKKLSFARDTYNIKVDKTMSYNYLKVTYGNKTIILVRVKKGRQFSTYNAYAYMKY